MNLNRRSRILCFDGREWGGGKRRMTYLGTVAVRIMWIGATRPHDHWLRQFLMCIRDIAPLSQDRTTAFLVATGQRPELQLSLWNSQGGYCFPPSTLQQRRAPLRYRARCSHKYSLQHSRFSCPTCIVESASRDCASLPTFHSFLLRRFWDIFRPSTTSSSVLHQGLIQVLVLFSNNTAYSVKYSSLL